eukprot:gene9036-16679_t
MGLGSGEYEFIVVEQDWLSLESKLESPFKWYVSSFPKTNKVMLDKEVKRMFPYTLILGVKHENNGYRKEYIKHTDMLKDRIRGPPFCSQYYYGIYRKLNVPLENIYLYDAAHVLALAMNRTLQRGKKVDDGLERECACFLVCTRPDILQIGDEKWFRVLTLCFNGYKWDCGGRFQFFVETENSSRPAKRVEW